MEMTRENYDKQIIKRWPLIRQWWNEGLITNENLDFVATTLQITKERLYQHLCRLTYRELITGYKGYLGETDLHWTNQNKLFIELSTKDSYMQDPSLYTRLFTALENENIDTIGAVITYTAGDLLKIPNLGRKSVNLLKELLAIKGYSLTC